jgi:hypothetical protein
MTPNFGNLGKVLILILMAVVLEMMLGRLGLAMGYFGKR